MSMDIKAKDCQSGELPMAMRTTTRTKERRERTVGATALGEGGRRAMLVCMTVRVGFEVVWL